MFKRSMFNGPFCRDGWKLWSGIVVGLLLCCAGSAKAQIAFLDTNNFPIVRGGGGSTAFSFATTVSAGAKVLIVCVNDRNANNASPPSLSWQGQTVTRAVQINNTAGTYRDSAIYYLFNPIAGAGNITGTFAASVDNWYVSVYTLVGLDTAIPPLTGSANSGSANTVSFTINNVPEGGWAATAATYANSGGYVSFSLYVTNGGAASGVVKQNMYNDAGPNTPNMMASASGLRAGTTTFYATEVGTSLNQKMSFVGAVFTPLNVYPPTGITAVGGTNQVSLTWNAAIDTTNYLLLRSTISGGPYTAISTTPATSYLDTGLSSGTTYYYVIRAQGPLGESVNSAQVSAITAPDGPASLAALPGDGRVTLNWPASVGAASYVVSRSLTSGTGYEPIATNSSTVFIDNTVANLTTYYYVVSARNAAGDSRTSSPEASAKPDIAPANLVATASSGQISLTWDVLAGATSYTVKRAPASAGPYSTIASGLTANSYVDGGLGDGFTYFYVVSAQVSGGQTAFSIEAFATTPFLPISLTTTPISISEIDLSWTTAGAGATLYKIERSTDGVNFTQVGTSTTLAYADIGGTVATRYYYRVRASNGIADSPYSSVVPGITYSILVAVNFGAGPLGTGGVMGDYPGYLRDIGEVYADRGNGYTYGWDVDNQANARTRLNSLSPDLRYDTLNHLQKQTPSRVWNIALPNGNYTVHIASGDATAFDSVFQFVLNTVTTDVRTPDTSNRWKEFTNNVTVDSGLLAVNSGPSASNNKICFIDIFAPSTAPSIVTEPQDMTVMEDSGPTNFAVSAVGSIPLAYQWYFGDTLLTGQTNRSLKLDLVRLSDQGNYHVVITNTWGAVTSRLATLTVTPDILPPYVLSVNQDLASGQEHRVVVLFSEAVLPSTATDVGNYSITGGFTITNAIMLDSRTVALYFDNVLTPGASYSLTINNVQDMALAPNTMTPSTTSFTAWSAVKMASNVRQLFYTNLAANTYVTNLFAEAKFVGNLPDSVSYLPSIDFPTGSTTNIADHSFYTYGTRISGYLIPSTSANYTFHILADDEGRFLLSTDENPAHLQTIVRYADGACCGSGVDSAIVPLTAGRAYYMEAYMKQNGGGDGLHVTWKAGSGSFAAIPSANLVFAYRPELLLHLTQQPVAQSLVEGQTANFFVGVFSTEKGVTYQWQANGTDIPNATNASYTPVAIGSMNGSHVRCVVSCRLETGSLAGSIPITVTSDQVPLTVLGTPPNLTVAGGIADMTVTWDSVPLATNYVLSRADTLEGPYNDILVTSATSFVQSGLPAGTVYYFRVASQGALGQSAWSAPVVGYTIPPAPTGLIAVPGDTQVTLLWHSTAGAVSYYIWRAASPGGPYSYVGMVSSTSYIDTGLVNNTSYSYKVQALNDAGVGPYSTPVTTTPSPAPAGVVAVGGTNAIYLQWTAMTGADSYNVKRALTANGPYTTIATGVSSASYADTASVASGTRYYYIVSATIGANESGNSLEVNAYTAPSAPTGFVTTATNFTSATLVWAFNDPIPATSFVIEQSREGAPFTVAGTADSAARTFTANNLDQAKNYSFRIQAVNETGYSPYSETAAFQGPYFTANVNFGAGPSGQGGVMPDYPAYLRDIGEVYGLKPNGFSYGWDIDIQADGRYRSNTNTVPPGGYDLRYDTLTHLQKTAGQNRVWEIEVPPGDYRIHIVGGDPDNLNTTNQFDLEAGQAITEALPMIIGTDTNHWREHFTGIHVSDGKLTLTCGPAVSPSPNGNVKICFIDILAPEPPAIVGQPDDYAVNEGAAVTFNVVATGAPVFYQWYFNDVPVTGATAPSLSVPYVRCTDEGQYYVTASNSFMTVTSRVATLTVTADITPPHIVWVGSLDGNTIDIVFDEPVRTDDGTFLGYDNWHILDDTITANLYDEFGNPTYYDYPVSQVLPWPDPNAIYSDKFILLLNGNPFNPHVSGPFSVECYYALDYSCAGNWAGSVGQSATTTWSQVDIWDPQPPGLVFVSSPNRMSVKAGGRDFWDNGDQFTYVYKQVNGDFDVRVTIPNLPDPPSGPLPNGWAKAGIMLRGSIQDTDGIVTNNSIGAATNSLMAYIVATPTNAGAQHTFASGVRYQNNTPAVDSPGALRPYLYSFPAQIRMIREGNNITTFSWSYVTNIDTSMTPATTNLVGIWFTNAVINTINWPSLMYLGLATTSHSQSNAVIATYENYTMIDRPVISTQPVSLVSTTGHPATLTVLATGPEEGNPLRYQWFKGGVAISRANSASYTIPSTVETDAGSYTVEVRNSAGAVLSSPATLSLVVAPTIDTQPADQVTTCGGSATFSVVAHGDGTLAYQWRLNGNPVEGGTTASLAVDNVSLATAGPYTVVITSEYGSTTSVAVNIVASDGSTPVLTTPGPVSGECGVPVNFTVTALNGCNFPVPVVCRPASGTLFPLGATTVNCVAHDPSGSEGTGSFVVNVADTIAPVISGCPANQSATTSSNTAVVTWTAPTAADLCAGTLPVVCTPASGSEFAIGTTAVDCVASDTQGHAAHCIFAVMVSSPQDPHLSVTNNGTTITVTWSKTPATFVLQYATSLGGTIPADWQDWQDAVNDNGTFFSVTVPNTGTQFFRLRLQL